MTEYIEREKAFKLIKEQKEKETGAYSKGRNKGLIIAGSIINNKEVLPTADVVEVKRGHWVKHSPDVAAMRAFHKLGIGKGMSENSIFWTCSCCDSWGSLTQKYCNQCGAKMDGGSDT